jgi:hypothetical protein
LRLSRHLLLLDRSEPASQEPTPYQNTSNRNTAPTIMTLEETVVANPLAEDQAEIQDILVLMIANFHNMKCPCVWLKSETAKKRKYLPVYI